MNHQIWVNDAHHSLLHSQWCLGTICGKLFFSSSPSFSFFSAIFLNCKNQIVDQNLRIVAHWWTLCESHLLRLYLVVCSSTMTPTMQVELVGTHWQLGKGGPGLICLRCIGRCHVMLMRQSSQGHSKLLRSKICVHNTRASGWEISTTQQSDI